jgi:hypothetical protein
MSAMKIFQDNDEGPQSLVTTPTKLQEQRNAPQWYQIESKHEALYQAFPDSESEANSLYQSLLHQMKSRTIDAHGCRRLVSIVKQDQDNCGLSFQEVWKNGGWSLKFQQAVIDYINDPQLDTSQLRMSWLLITQFLLADSSSFEGYTRKLSHGLVRLSARLDWKNNLGEKLPGQVFDTLLPTCKLSSERAGLFDGLLDGYEECTTGADSLSLSNVLYFTMSSLKKTVDRTKDVEQLNSRLGRMCPIAFEVLNSNNLPHARRLGYLLIVSLKQKLKASEADTELSELIRSHMSTDQQRFLEAILAKLTIS